jgi:hypothetical protein
VKEVDAEKGVAPRQDDGTVEIPEAQVKVLEPGAVEVSDGAW